MVSNSVISPEVRWEELRKRGSLMPSKIFEDWLPLDMVYDTNGWKLIKHYVF